MDTAVNAQAVLNQVTQVMASTPMDPPMVSSTPSDPVSQTVAYQVLHSSRGRMRLSIPRLKLDPTYPQSLQALLASLAGVAAVRINPAAGSVVINFQDPTLVPDDWLPQLIDIIQQATDPTASVCRLKADWFEVTGAITAYEAQQILAIDDWEAEPPEAISTAVATVLYPVKVLTDVLLPLEVLQATLRLCDQVTTRWQDDWDWLQAAAEITHHHELGQKSLEICDRLTQTITNRAITLSDLEGGTVALLETFGEMADIPLSIILALQTIHQVGLCYGYSPQTALEQEFAWRILGVSTAMTPEEKNSGAARTAGSPPAARSANPGGYSGRGGGR
ncbi:hypothetical protein DO97_12645 [Neosynechococcus sphagnicola sy1]|uniref:Uncharacterized protein n=1 Tax=Neosynechococcus sphagnicola sy1 TaxID=1497020 RepID=A0A098TP70_9CYAN|nr:EcsC family protein [Neosynechococcus sphagnicola]KGF73677.1 hypothetical protein DO97_12645 [Neosynechococcus sphagnicola sy1]